MSTLSIILSIVNLLLLSFFIIYYFKKLKIHREGKKRISILEIKNEIIISINRKESTSEIANTLMSATIDLFGFDYVTISMVNNLKNTISTEFFSTKNEKLVNPKKWADRSKYDLMGTDILCEVVREKNVVKILGQNLDQEIQKTLNILRFEKYNHKNLDRVFTPILHRSLTTDPDSNKVNDIVLGVVEAGLQNSTKKGISDELIAEYNLFINNCEQSFYRAQNNQEKELVQQLTSKYYEIDDHHLYLESLLLEMVNLIDADFGAISFMLYDEEKIKYGVITNFPSKENINSSSFVPFIIDMNSIPTGFVNHAITYNEYYFSNDVKNNENYKSITVTANSELAIPMRYQDIVIGVLNFESSKKDFFNKNKATLIQEIIDKITPVYIKKKLNTVLKNLVIPFDNITDISSIYNQTIEIIEDYFSSGLVCIWEKTYDSANEYSIVKKSLRLKEILKKNTISKDSINIFSEFNYPILLSESQIATFTNNSSLKKFFLDNSVKSVVISPLNYNNNNHGFISLFSKHNLQLLFPEDIIFLTEISRKVTLTIQYAKLVNSFYNISSLFNYRNQRNTLKVIADGAREVLLADSVHLYQYDSDEGKINKDLIVSGKLLHPELKNIVNQKKPTDTYLIDYIIQNDIVLFENQSDYEKFNRVRPMYMSNYFKESFWYREGIKSMIGIRLKYNHEPIGVMFFNFKTEQIFDDKTKQLINVFASFASINSINAKNLEIINDQSIKLKEKYDKIKFDYEDTYNKMKEMIPLATRTSFYLILRGINHDIRNLLLSLKQSSVRISKSSDRLERKLRISVDNNISDISRNIKVVSNLLELFDFTTFKEEYVDTTKVINDVVYFFKEREGTNIIFDNHELDSSLDLLKCIKAEFSMIVYNLLSNSLKAISIANPKYGLIKLRSSISNNNYILNIHDNGIGIDSTIKSRIYEPGFSSLKDGLGIGLYFIKEVLESSFKGSISCNSKYGVFTEFTITIPYR
jgi:signal transduction histidine kinase/GAF domain-containing protein